MKVFLVALILIIILIIAGCIEKFTPEIQGSKFLLVVNGLITDQPEVNTVRLYWSIPPGEKISVPLAGCDVSVHDDLGNVYKFKESSTPGTYNSDTGNFQGVVGRKYSLHINTDYATPTHYSYKSEPVEMKAVPPINNLYYEKVRIKEATPPTSIKEGCRIYLDTYDPEGDCRSYRWDYIETWKFQIPYFDITNQICWISNNSKNIDIKSTSVLSEDRISRHPVTFITNETDRLRERYSILVNQYSISEDEFVFWQKIRDVTQDIGGLYDMIPSSIQGNLFCIDEPREQVLGYFSVSARTSKRIYIDEIFAGLVNPYANCEDEAQTYAIGETIPNLNENKWIIIYKPEQGYVVTTWHHECADCTVRGTTIKPEFWIDSK